MSYDVAVRFFGGPLNGEERRMDSAVAHYGYRHPVPMLNDVRFSPEASLVPQFAQPNVAEYRYVCRWFLVDRDGSPDLAGPEVVDMEWQPPHEFVEAHRALNRLRESWGIGGVGFAELGRAWRRRPPWDLAADVA